MKREYVMTARAEAAQATADRIIAAMLARIVKVPYDDVRLEDIAADAGVTVQTVLRRFGSKEGLARACDRAYAQRSADGVRIRPRPGDIRGAVESVLAQYEESGDLLLHVMQQSVSVPVFAEFTERGSAYHAEWCREAFDPFLDQRSGVARERLLAQVVAVTDVHTWFLLRRQRGLSRRQTILATIELLEGLLT